MSPNLIAAVSLWSALWIQAPTVALGLEPKYRTMSFAGKIAFPLSPFGARWLPPAKWLYSLLLFPYLLPLMLMMWCAGLGQRCLRSCPLCRRCVFCLLFAMVLASLWELVRAKHGYAAQFPVDLLGLLVDVCGAIAIWIWTLITPFVFVRLYAFAIKASAQDIRAAKATWVHMRMAIAVHFSCTLDCVSARRRRRRRRKASEPLLEGHARVSPQGMPGLPKPLALPDDHCAKLVKLNKENYEADFYGVAEAVEMAPVDMADAEKDLTDSKLRIVLDTLTAVAYAVRVQILLITFLRSYIFIDDFRFNYIMSVYQSIVLAPILALHNTLNERTMHAFSFSVGSRLSDKLYQFWNLL